MVMLIMNMMMVNADPAMSAFISIATWRGSTDRRSLSCVIIVVITITIIIKSDLHAMVMIVDIAGEQTVSSDLLTTFAALFRWLLQFIILLLLLLSFCFCSFVVFVFKYSSSHIYHSLLLAPKIVSLLSQLHLKCSCPKRYSQFHCY